MSEFYSPEKFFYSLPKYAKCQRKSANPVYISLNHKKPEIIWKHMKQSETKKKNVFMFLREDLYLHIVNVVTCGRWDGKSQHLHNLEHFTGWIVKLF